MPGLYTENMMWWWNNSDCTQKWQMANVAYDASSVGIFNRTKCMQSWAKRTWVGTHSLRVEIVGTCVLGNLIHIFLKVCPWGVLGACQLDVDFLHPHLLFWWYKLVVISHIFLVYWVLQQIHGHQTQFGFRNGSNWCWRYMHSWRPSTTHVLVGTEDMWYSVILAKTECVWEPQISNGYGTALWRAVIQHAHTSALRLRNMPMAWVHMWQDWSKSAPCIVATVLLSWHVVCHTSLHCHCCAKAACKSLALQIWQTPTVWSCEIISRCAKQLTRNTSHIPLFSFLAKTVRFMSDSMEVRTLANFFFPDMPCFLGTCPHSRVSEHASTAFSHGDQKQVGINSRGPARDFLLPCKCGKSNAMNMWHILDNIDSCASPYDVSIIALLVACWAHGDSCNTHCSSSCFLTDKPW